jgi:hypothetical protein
MIIINIFGFLFVLWPRRKTMSQVAVVITALEDKVKDTSAKLATAQTQLDSANAQIATLTAQLADASANVIDDADKAAIVDATALLAQK